VSFGKDLRFLMIKLLSGYHLYFDKNDVLNSDGRKLFEEIARMLVYEHPEYKKVVSKARRNPSLENILKVAEIFMDRSEAEKVLKVGIYGPYSFRVL